MIKGQITIFALILAAGPLVSKETVSIQGGPPDRAGANGFIGHCEEARPTSPLTGHRDGRFLETLRVLPKVEHQRVVTEQSGRIEASRARIQEVFASRTREAGYAFQSSRSLVDAFGQTHVRFSQNFNGVKIWGAEGITHMNADRSFKKETLALNSGLDLNTTPAIDSKEALAIVHKDLAPKGTYATEPSAELVVYPETKQIIHRFRTSGKRIPNALEAEDIVQKYHLAYHVHVELDNAQDKVIHRDYMVDARNGNILSGWSSLQTSDPAEGRGNSQYSGSVYINTTETEGGFELKDTTRPTLPHPFEQDKKDAVVGNIVYNSNHGKGMEKGAIYTDQDNTWGDGLNYTGTSTIDGNGQTAAVDAAYGMQVTWDFLGNVLGRNGIDDKGSSTYSRVHHEKDFDNAFWMDGCFCMTFGDGSPKGFTVLTALDVIAHEMGHGVNSNSAGLIYKNESGGLNEANSDILGTMAEFYAKGGGYDSQSDRVPETGGNWTMGEQLSKRPLRYMHKPSKDRMSPDAWYPGIGELDVHFSGGPMNRAFYFLSQGATSTGDTSAPSYLPKGMSGIGNTNAVKIWYRALTTYMPKSANNKEARYACLRAAEDISSYEDFKGSPVSQDDAIAAVQNAFAGVNVGFTADQAKDMEAPVVNSLDISGHAGLIHFNAAATDDTKVALVEFWVDGNLMGSVTGGTDGVFAYALDSAQLANGQHRVMVKAYDAEGNVGYYPEEKSETAFEIKNAVNNLINNVGFEFGSSFWMGRNAILDTKKENAHSGNHSIVIGGIGKKTESFLYQEIPGAVAGKKATLNFWLSTTTKETGNAAVDNLMVYMVDKKESPESMKVFCQASNLDASSGYVRKTVVLNDINYKEGCMFLIVASENEGNPTSWRLDDISLVVE